MGRSRNLAGANAEFGVLETAMKQLQSELSAIAPKNEKKTRIKTGTKRRRFIYTNTETGEHLTSLFQQYHIPTKGSGDSVQLQKYWYKRKAFYLAYAVVILLIVVLARA